MTTTDLDYLETKPKVLVMYEGIECEDSLYLFKKSNPIRKACYIVMMHPVFEFVVLAIICFTCMKLVADSYITETNPPLATEISLYMDYFLTAFFCAEAGMKIIACGFIVDEGSYWRESWNKMDLVITIAGVLDVALTSVNITFIRVKISWNI